MSSAYSIVVVSDFVCPWCLIGTRRLEVFLAKHEASVTFRPFLLDPTIPREGVDLRAHLAKKFGSVPDSMFGRVEQAARDVNVNLDFEKVRRYPSTLAAHAIVRNAKPETHLALGHALFDAYFMEGRDIGDAEVLADIAAAHGFDRADAMRIARDDNELQKARDEAREMSEEGIRGVPFFVFNERVAISGAQPLEVFERAFAESMVASG
jgi:predicted DsbA family dithiol-disulfide isomerase